MLLFFLICNDHLINPDDMTSSFEQHRIAPAPIHLADPLASTYFTESEALVEFDTRFILGKDAGLKRPQSMALRGSDQGLQQCTCQTLRSVIPTNVYADFSYTSVYTPSRDRAERRPALHNFGRSGDVAARRQMGGVPFFPQRRIRFERCVTSGDTLKVDGAHLL